MSNGRDEIRDSIAAGNEPGDVWDDAADTAGIADDEPEDEAQARRRADGDPMDPDERR